jgi:DNA-binding NtrC family response regulator
LHHVALSGGVFMSPRSACLPRPTLPEPTADSGWCEQLFAEDQENFVGEDAPTRAAQIIVADDDPDMRELLAQVLRSDGHEIAEARNGDELFQRLGSFWARGSEPDLVISDVRMPGCTGLGVLAHMNEDDRFAPVILITGFGDHELHARAITLGAVAVLDKPFDLDELRELVRRVLKGMER